MEQVYYTQCPMGYGLGASNGFQVKRLSPGYPIRGDFHHLGLRSFLSGGRALAPPVLRYRRAEDGVAELAWLTPRSHEYQTERGLWGRPGGHFAHGVRLDAAEMNAIHHWPAGLFDRPFWRRSDPEATRGRGPDPLEVSPDWLANEPSFMSAARLAAGLDPAWLATLFSALAAAVRGRRTLVLVDQVGRLPGHVALLTLGFPEVAREALTFSTYHDRPEDLAGFRLQGTAPDPKANRAVLVAQGFFADMGGATIEPAIAAARWARTLACWLTGQSEDDRAAWLATAGRAAAAKGASGPETFWSEDWLNHLYELPRLVGPGSPPPRQDEEWRSLEVLTCWARAEGLGRDVAAARRPDWWRQAANGGEEARQAALAHLQLRESWTGSGNPAEWGAALASWLELCPPMRRQGWLAELVHAVPGRARPGFVRGLFATATPQLARSGVGWLRAQPAIDPLALLPLEVRSAVERSRGEDVSSALAQVLARALAARGCLIEVLDALASEVSARRDVRPEAERAFGAVLATADEPASRALLAWALAREDEAEGWLGPYLCSLSASPEPLEQWSLVSRRIAPGQATAFTRVALEVARDPGVPDEVFRWGIEMLLLPLPESDRPRDPDWPGLYLDRTPSGLDLVRRLFAREYRDLGVKRWLDQARQRGELTTEHAARIEVCLRYARALKSGDPRVLIRVELPAVPAEERGALLAQMLSRVGTVSDETLGLALDTCRAAWPGGFARGAEGLAGIAEAIAERLEADRAYPDVWLDRVYRVVTRLGLRAEDQTGFEPGGLAAAMIAATVRQAGAGFFPWRFRAFLLQHDEAWRALDEDMTRDLRGRTVAEYLDTLEQWDRNLVKGVHSARFFEVWLNCCEHSALAAVVAARAHDLKTLPGLSWWRRGEHEDARDDLRDAFARLAPLSPLDEDALNAVQGWMRASDRAAHASPVRSIADGDLVPIDAEVQTAPRGGAADTTGHAALSEFGQARWRCIEALSAFHRTGLGSEACWQLIEGWSQSLPIAQLVETERYVFLDWLIPRLGEHDDLKVARLASWLVRAGLTDPDQVVRWPDELGAWAEIPDSLRQARAALVSALRSEWKTVLREARERTRKTTAGGFP
jgi:hypothetical protein